MRRPGFARISLPFCFFFFFFPKQEGLNEHAMTWVWLSGEGGGGMDGVGMYKGRMLGIARLRQLKDECYHVVLITVV